MTTLERKVWQVLWHLEEGCPENFVVLKNQELLTPPPLTRGLSSYLKINQNYSDLRCLLDILVLTQQTKGVGTLAAYCSVESSGVMVLAVGLTVQSVNSSLHTAVQWANCLHWRAGGTYRTFDYL